MSLSHSVTQIFTIFIFIHTIIARQSQLQTESIHTTTEEPKITIIYRDSLNTKYDFPFVQIPYFASVFYNPGNYVSFTYEYICSASLISFQWGLTAASCQKPPNNDAETYVITAGFLANPSITVDSSAIEFVRGQRRLISKWILHPNYTNTDFHKNDIALLKIDRSFQLNSFVNLINLLPLSKDSFCDISSLYSSCSTPMYKNKMLTETNNLLLLTVFLTSVLNCKKYTANGQEITGGSSHICSINELDSRKCVGSLGSPLICKNVQIGIMLDVFACNDSNWSLYTRVDLYQQWIEQHVLNGLWYETHFNPVTITEYFFFHLCERDQLRSRIYSKNIGYIVLSNYKNFFLVVILVDIV